ncbi:MAG TPA: hypothetical protein DGT23_24820 [Micromonosporaceae bacterium]|nr:hypothetical protein [Micromonosporaceae bacterium]
MNDHDDLASVFEAYRATAARSFMPADAETIYHAAHTRKTRRMTVTAATVLLVTGVLSTTLMIKAPVEVDHNPPVVSQSPNPVYPISPSIPPSATPSPARPGAEPATGPEPGNQVRFVNEPTVQRIRNATLTLPAWRDQPGTCRAGQFTFVSGKAPLGPDEIGRPTDYLVFFRGSMGIYANLDGKPGDEMAIPMACGSVEVNYQLLVIKEVTGSFQTLGYIPGIVDFQRFYPAGGDLWVEVNNDPPASTAEQRRRYHWNGTRFVQTAGPTAFSPNGPPDVRDVDLRNSYFQFITISSEDFQPCGGGLLSFVDSRSGTWPYRDRDFPGDTVKPATAFELGEISAGVLTEPDPPVRGAALVTVRCQHHGSVWETWLGFVTDAKAVGVLKVGNDGVTGIVSHRIVDGVAELIVTTRTGQQTWRYRSNGYTLVRIP